MVQIIKKIKRKIMKKLFFIMLLCVTYLYSSQKIVILGGGIGGLTSSIYLSRAGIEPMIIEGNQGSSILKSLKVENWPSQIEITGENLIKKLRDQAIKNGCTIKESEVIDIDFSKKPFKIFVKNSLGKQEVILSDACIISMGASAKMLNVKGEKNLIGKGVSICAACDGALYKDKIVAIIGGGNKAILEALYLSNIVKKLYIILKGEDFKKDCDQKNKRLLMKKNNVILVKNTILKEVLGKNNVEAIRVKNNREQEIKLSGVFYSVGSVPNTQIFSKKIDLDDKKYIIVDKDRKTSVEDVYAIGDIVNHSKQAIYASCDGAKAVESYLRNLWKKEFSENKVESFTKSNSKFSKNYIIEISSLEQFDIEMKDSNIPVCLDFYSPRCFPCKKINPIINSFAEKFYKKIKILKINISRFHRLAEKYQIRSVPTLILIDGDEQIRKNGTRDIIEFLKVLEKRYTE